MPEAYAIAALRHHADAESLSAQDRLDNAGHLIGLAAECAIKHAYRLTEPDEGLPKIHLPDLANHVVRFDTAIPLLAEIVLRCFNEQTLSDGVFLRDAVGRVTFVIRSAIEPLERERFDQEAKALSSTYFDPPSATPRELFDETLADPSIGVVDSPHIDGALRAVRIIDRRIIGQDWETPNFTPAASIPVVTFFSCKGGVGRSTALAVAAAAFSDAGKNVLVLDFDLEAPGIGAMLLPKDERPEFGVLDYFVEQGLSDVGDAFLERMIAPSPLTAGRGLVEVMPARTPAN